MRAKLTDLIYKRDIGLWSDTAKIALDTNRIDMFIDKLIEEDQEDSIRVKKLIGPKLYNQFRRLQKAELIKRLEVVPTPSAYFIGVFKKNQYRYEATLNGTLIVFSLSEMEYKNDFRKEHVIGSLLLKKYIIDWKNN